MKAIGMHFEAELTKHRPGTYNRANSINDLSSGVPKMTPTAGELSVRAAALKGQIRALTSNIAAKAPNALNSGGDAAYQQIKTWNAERAELTLELEVIEQAMRSPEVRLAGLEQRLNDQFRHQRRGMQSNLVHMLRDKYGWLLAQGSLTLIAAAAVNLRDPAHLGISDARRIPLAELPLCYAAMLSREAEARYELAQYELFKGRLGSPSQHSDEERAKPDRLRATVEIRIRHTAQLLASTTLPELPEALRRFV